MRDKIPVLIIFLCVVLPAFSQQANGHRRTPPTYGCPFSDGFSGSGSLSSNWTGITPFGTSLIQPNSGVAQASTGSNAATAYVNTNSNCTFGASQFAEVVIQTYASGTYVGLLLLTNGSTGYRLRCEAATNCTIVSFNPGTTTIVTCSAGVAAGNTLGFASTISGGTVTLTGYVNTGSGWTAITGCSGTSTLYTSGSPALYLFSGSPTTDLQVKSFQAGNGNPL